MRGTVPGLSCCVFCYLLRPPSEIAVAAHRGQTACALNACEIGQNQRNTSVFKAFWPCSYYNLIVDPPDDSCCFHRSKLLLSLAERCLVFGKAANLSKAAAGRFCSALRMMFFNKIRWKRSECGHCAQLRPDFRWWNWKKWQTEKTLKNTLDISWDACIITYCSANGACTL